MYTVASPEYFEVLGIPFAAGRNFNSDDLSGRASTAIVSEGLARRFWPSENPLGRTLRVTASMAPVTVVGVAGMPRPRRSGARRRCRFIFPPRRAPTSGDCTCSFGRVRIPPRPLSALRQIAATLDPDLRFEAVPLDKLLSLWLLPSRVAAAGATVLGLLALALASIGIYGVLAYVVAQRTREIGVRIALGASPAHVVHLILGEGFSLIAVGVVLGLAGAGAGAPLLRTLLLDVSTIDPLAFGAASLALTAVALCACYVPARRAARLPPLVALRAE